MWQRGKVRGFYLVGWWKQSNATNSMAFYYLCCHLNHYKAQSSETGQQLPHYLFLHHV